MAAHGKGYQSERVVINVTPEQAAAVKAALRIAVQTRQDVASENDVLVDLLSFLVESTGGHWPEHVKAQGQRTDLKRTPKD